MEESGGVEQILEKVFKASEEPGVAPPIVAAEVARLLQERGLPIPNPCLAEMLVSNLCFSKNTPFLWKFLEQLMASGLVSSFQILALLTPRVILSRKEQPEAYRLYLELLRRYALDLPSSAHPATCTDLILKSIDDALELSQTYAVELMEIELAVVLFIFTAVSDLLHCLTEDSGIDVYIIEELKASGTDAMQGIEAGETVSDEEISNRVKHLRATNTLVTLEVLEEITANKKAQEFLRLVNINMPQEFMAVLDSKRVIEDHRERTNLPPSKVENLLENITKAMKDRNYSGKHSQFSFLFDTRPCSSYFFGNMGASNSACWIPLDVFMENVMDGRNLHAVSIIEALNEVIRTLKVINQASWQETFQALWVSALRLVQRGCESLEGQVLDLHPRFSMLLAIIPLSIALFVRSKESEMDGAEKEWILLRRRHGLISSLQVLKQFSWLLSPPPALVVLANDAAKKAIDAISKMKGGTSNQKVVGSMLHLIVEACIARELIDTSAYFWPGYVVASQELAKDPIPNKESPWSAFMQGAKLSESLQDILIATPASSIAELKKLYGLALNGLEEERLAASRILCGASLTCGWNIQEHAAQMVVKLLAVISPPESLVWNNYIQHMPMLHAILSSISSIDTVHILSLYGLMPEVAASLMPICEAFGSLPPPSNHKSCTTDKISTYSVFSSAFLLLLRLWKFYWPPLEHCANARQDLTLEYLLLLRNRHAVLKNPDARPVCINSFPKLQAWYFQNEACLFSTTSVVEDDPVRLVADMILNMVFSKKAISDRSSSTSSGDQHVGVPALPAWEILEVLPIVLEAILTACAHGQLGSRDLTIGLKEIVDFLPASLAAIITYFSTEITRGIWKPVVLNGTEWPSPAANLLLVDQEIKELLASAGVHIPCCYPRGMEPKLPLPMAILVSLTITFNVERNLDYIHGLFGQAMENCIGSNPWPCMPIIGALWTLKARRWHDFILLGLSRLPFVHDRDAVSQLIRSCFSSFLGPTSLAGGSLSESSSGAVGLFGTRLIDNGILKHVAPGSLYVHSCRMFLDMHHAGDVIFRLVIERAHEIAEEWASKASVLSSDRTSLSVAVSKVRQVALLASSMLCLAGGLKLVKVLYEELFPTLLLLVGEGKNRTGTAGPAGHVGNMLGGYAIAYLLVLSGALIWGVGKTSLFDPLVYSSQRARVFGKHMDFLARLMEGETLPGCDPGTWKVYVLSFFRLLISLAARWIGEVKVETLKKLASGLRRWHEHELALALLERGGPGAMSAVLESLS